MKNPVVSIREGWDTPSCPLNQFRPAWNLSVLTGSESNGNIEHGA